MFNSGLDYARKLGLTRVLQDDIEAGNMLGEELYKANFSKPLTVQLSSLDDDTSERRRLGIQQAIGHDPALLKVFEASNVSAMNTPVQFVRDAFLSNPGAYDSIISLGGSVGLFILRCMHLFYLGYITNTPRYYSHALILLQLQY